MSGFEWNKVMGAVLLAGLIASLAGFFSRVMVHPVELKENAYVVEVAEDTTAAGDAGAKDTGPGDIKAMLAKADVAKGQKLSSKCTSCHNFEEGGATKIGPDLYNIVGAKQASKDFAYSAALTGKKGTWTYDELNHWLYNPKDYAPGTKMVFVGLKKDDERADLIAWLRTLSPSPIPLPK